MTLKNSSLFQHGFLIQLVTGQEKDHLSDKLVMSAKTTTVQQNYQSAEQKLSVVCELLFLLFMVEPLTLFSKYIRCLFFPYNTWNINLN